MTDHSRGPRSENPNAPKIPRVLYLVEKENFAGALIGAIFYGIVVVLFFRCMIMLLNPTDRLRGGIRWGLVAHVTVMFSFATIYVGMNLDLQSISYIDNRGFPDDESPLGPFAYQATTSTKAINVVPSVLFLLNNWLADGLLLYRCFMIYAMSYWIMAFPCLMYLTSFATGVAFICLTLVEPPDTIGKNFDLGNAYYTVSFSLNALLTLMIVTRLLLHIKKIRSTTGTLASASGLYRAIVTMVIESASLYAVSFLLYFVPWAAKSTVAYTFSPLLVDIQVIAPFLIIQRVASRRALTSETIGSGEDAPILIAGQEESTSSNESLPDGCPMIEAGMNGQVPGEPNSRDRDATETFCYDAT